MEQVDISNKYQTRDGREVEIYKIHSRSSGPYPVHGVIYDSSGRTKQCSWDLFGNIVTGGIDNSSDIIRKKELIEYDFYVFLDDSGNCIGSREKKPSTEDGLYIHVKGSIEKRE